MTETHSSSYQKNKRKNILPLCLYLDYFTRKRDDSKRAKSKVHCRDYCSTRKRSGNYTYQLL